MEYMDVDFERILVQGKRLGNSYQTGKIDCNSPVLCDDLVYKFFLQSPTKKERLILQLEKLHLRYLSKIRGLFMANGKKGYIYEYSISPLLADKLRSSISFQDRLRYIEELIKTRSILDQNGLTYFDYHSANILAGNDIEMIDVDSIKSNRINNRVAIDRYFIELLVSIFMNFDITFNDDNSYLYDLFYRFFNGSINMFDNEFDMDTIYDTFLKMNIGDALELQSEVKRTA